MLMCSNSNWKQMWCEFCQDKEKEHDAPKSFPLLLENTRSYAIIFYLEPHCPLLNSCCADFGVSMREWRGQSLNAKCQLYIKNNNKNLMKIQFRVKIFTFSKWNKKNILLRVFAEQNSPIVFLAPEQGVHMFYTLNTIDYNLHGN